MRQWETSYYPLYFEGQYTGADAVLPSDLPYHGTTECEDRTYVDGQMATGGAPDEVADDPAPWWMFWRNWR